MQISSKNQLLKVEFQKYLPHQRISLQFFYFYYAFRPRLFLWERPFLIIKMNPDNHYDNQNHNGLHKGSNHKKGLEAFCQSDMLDFKRNER